MVRQKIVIHNASRDYSRPSSGPNLQLANATEETPNQDVKSSLDILQAKITQPAICNKCRRTDLIAKLLIHALPRRLSHENT